MLKYIMPADRKLKPIPVPEILPTISEPKGSEYFHQLKVDMSFAAAAIIVEDAQSGGVGTTVTNINEGNNNYCQVTTTYQNDKGETRFVQVTYPTYNKIDEKDDAFIELNKRVDNGTFYPDTFTEIRFGRQQAINIRDDEFVFWINKLDRGEPHEIVFKVGQDEKRVQYEHQMESQKIKELYEQFHQYSQDKLGFTAQ